MHDDGVAGVSKNNQWSVCMNRVLKKASRVWFAITVCIAVFGLQSCASVEPELVKQQDGYLYGYGKGETPEEAELEAKRDLVENALEFSMQKRTGEARRVYVSRQSAGALSLETKRVAELEDETSMSVTLRVSEEDWMAYEAEREAALRQDLDPALARLNGDLPYAQRAGETAEILSTLEIAGVDGLLAVESEGPLLFDVLSETLEAQAEQVSVSFSPAGGILSEDPVVTVNVAHTAGKPLEGIPLTALWSRDGDPVGETVSVQTDGQGTALIRFPVDGDTGSQSLSLRVTANFAGKAKPDTRRTAVRLSAIDDRISAEATYVMGESLANRFGPFIRVEAGPFEMGAVSGDKRASKREAARTMETGTYDIAVQPVTNAQYRLFLDATAYENVPEFLDNPDYTVPEQPVVGITRSDAEAFAAWLSGIMGTTVRLPTEAEWEKAAKAGQNVAFPWGNDSPVEGIRANFRGNGKFNRPSPVASFPDGVNPWGLHDMAGNVWELVSTLPEEVPMAKGGSWMEGPNDLRISNRREINPEKTYADVGFRVVMEVKK